MDDDLAHKHGLHETSAWVRRFLPGIKEKGSILDVACGAGRHMRLALELGYSVIGIDKDLSQVEDIAARKDVGLIEADLETGRAFPLKDMAYDGVIVTNYLWRPILSDIIGCVADDGVLIYETFAAGHERQGKPCDPDFLLKANELIEAALPRLTVLAYEHGLREGEYPKIVQRIAACGPEHPWAGDTPVSI
ncbi:MAG: class I SAM-dependent methyltransferase [Alphaproteobacteria bacterium]